MNGDRKIDLGIAVSVFDLLSKAEFLKNLSMRKQRLVTWMFAISLLFSIALHGFLLNFERCLPRCHARTNEALIIPLFIMTEARPLYANEKGISRSREGNSSIKASSSESTFVQPAHNAVVEQKVETGAVSILTPRSLKKSIRKMISTDTPSVAAKSAILGNPVSVTSSIHAKSRQNTERGGFGAASKTGSINRGGVILKPVIKNFERPRYPSLARRHGHEGTVVLEMEIFEDGIVGKVAIISSSRYAELDNAAQKALENASCIPARLNGIPMRSLLKKEITFRLTD
ncbi:MAG: TonB family protein [Proteobacteria bacterium]|nr:TonB family protein [Pseudomonadota bacterium]MBU4295561.1 TonB family protein [Pseudomonadota bacterium]MCG2747680.1 TonB family protein [Desulfobulbaceae bacterium]